MKATPMAAINDRGCKARTANSGPLPQEVHLEGDLQPDVDISGRCIRGRRLTRIDRPEIGAIVWIVIEAGRQKVEVVKSVRSLSTKRHGDTFKSEGLFQGDIREHHRFHPDGIGVGWLCLLIFQQRNLDPVVLAHVRAATCSRWPISAARDGDDTVELAENTVTPGLYLILVPVQMLPEVVVAQRIRISRQGSRLTTLESEVGRDDPAAENGIGNSVFVKVQQASAADWQFIGATHLEHLGKTEVVRAALGNIQCLVHPAPLLDLLGPGVARVEGKPVRDALIEISLQGVVPVMSLVEPAGIDG